MSPKAIIGKNNSWILASKGLKLDEEGVCKLLEANIPIRIKREKDGSQSCTITIDANEIFKFFALLHKKLGEFSSISSGGHE